jgi:hypothetical protein
MALPSSRSGWPQDVADRQLVEDTGRLHLARALSFSVDPAVYRAANSGAREAEQQLAHRMRETLQGSRLDADGHSEVTFADWWAGVAKLIERNLGPPAAAGPSWNQAVAVIMGAQCGVWLLGERRRDGARVRRQLEVLELPFSKPIDEVMRVADRDSAALTFRSNLAAATAKVNWGHLTSDAAAHAIERSDELPEAWLNAHIQDPNLEVASWIEYRWGAAALLANGGITLDMVADDPVERLWSRCRVAGCDALCSLASTALEEHPEQLRQLLDSAWNASLWESFDTTEWLASSGAHKPIRDL